MICTNSLTSNGRSLLIATAAATSSNKKENKMTSKNIIVDWNEITINLTNGTLTKIAQFAAQYGVSRPTAKKMLADHYGTSIVFNRGRTGGIVFNPVATTATA